MSLIEHGTLPNANPLSEDVRRVQEIIKQSLQDAFLVPKELFDDKDCGNEYTRQQILIGIQSYLEQLRGSGAIVPGFKVELGPQYRVVKWIMDRKGRIHELHEMKDPKGERPNWFEWHTPRKYAQRGPTRLLNKSRRRIRQNYRLHLSRNWQQPVDMFFTPVAPIRYFTATGVIV
ncbi:hypothetical protein [Ralstonia phage phiRSL1]|uniref:Uncharacterized protein n=1 Tax=Ralstonia phage phiRSL1 TaxID=1980924 RepID=B2ZY86_9CAUD|nr:hypothetical protein RSL1_ORF274 [Ralstonia phage phiRSL1]BAG41721.1 hypothetical protein [Ralstonia phage phiRSL1]